MRILQYLVFPTVLAKRSVFERIRSLFPGQKEPKLSSTSEAIPTDPIELPRPSPDELIVRLAMQQGKIDWIRWPYDRTPAVPEKFVIQHQSDYAELSARMKDLFGALIEQDAVNQASAPYLLYDAEVLPGPEWIQLVRDPPIALNPDVTVYGRLYRYHVVKYQTNCRSLDKSIMDLERDYIFLKQVESLGVAPAAFFLSPPVKLPSFRTPKTRFSMKDSDYETCAEDPRSYVRYMLMAKGIVTVSHLMKTMLVADTFERYLQAFKIARDVVENLERLHSAGIVHRDIHQGNLVQMTNNAFGLIDFGKSFFEGDMTDGLYRFNIHWSLTHWNLQGSRFGFRDDVYKALLAASFVAVPSRFKECWAMGRTEDRREELIKWHANKDLFEPDDLALFTIAFPNATKREMIRHSFWSAVELARSVVSVSARPDYSGILAHLKVAYENITRLPRPMT